MDRFYATAFDVLVAHDAFVDKFVGDEVIGIFVPAVTEGLHAREAVNAGLELLAATGHGSDEPWIRIVIGVNTGVVAYVGAVGTKEHVGFTALGDEVNITAGLATAAGTGELLATEAAVRAAGLLDRSLECRTVALKGKSEPMTVAVVTLAAGVVPAASGVIVSHHSAAHGRKSMTHRLEAIVEGVIEIVGGFAITCDCSLHQPLAR